MEIKRLASFFLRQTALSTFLGSSLLIVPVPGLCMEEGQESQRYGVPLRASDNNNASKEEEGREKGFFPFHFLNPLIIKATHASSDSFEDIKKELSQTAFKDTAIFASLRQPQELIKEKKEKASLSLKPVTVVREGLEKSLIESEEKVRPLLEKLINYYQEFEKRFAKSSSEERHKLSMTPVKLSLFGDPNPVFIEQDMAYRLISKDAYEYPMRTNEEGLHPVASVNGLHFKVHTHHPLFPGMETAMYHLHKRLLPSVINPSTLIYLEGVKMLALSKGSRFYQFIMDDCAEKKISPEEFLKRNPDVKEKVDKEAASQEGNYFLQASKTVEGKTLSDLLAAFQKKGDIRGLCTGESFSAFCLGSFLANPTDGKPANIMVERETKALIGIDNDQGFADAIVVKEGKHYPAVKNIVYFLGPLMETPVDAGVRERLLARTPVQFLREWLQDLREENERYGRAVSGERQDELNLPIRFVPGTLPEIYRKLCLLQACLRENNDITHSQLFRILEPALSLYYQFFMRETPHEDYDKIHTPIAFEDMFKTEAIQLKEHSLKQELSRYTQGLWDYIDKKTQNLEEAEKELLRTEGVGTELLRQAIREKDNKLIQTLFSLGVGDSESIIGAIRTSGILLPYLDLSQKKLNDSQAIELGKALSHHSSLTELNVRDNEIKKEGFAGLTQGLNGHHSLTSLDLSDNRLLEIQQSTPLKALSQLQKLNVSYTKLNDQGVMEVVKSLPHLTRIEAGATEISGEGARFIIQNLKSLTFINISRTKSAIGIIPSLANHAFLKELDISHNSLSDKETVSLAKVLKGNPPLVSLNLRYNMIEKEGALKLAKALQSNQHLQLLNLGNNKVGDQGAKGIAKALETNHTLTSLTLNKNFISDTGAASLRESLFKNDRLRFMDLTLNEISEKEQEKIKSLFSKRKSLSLRL